VAGEGTEKEGDGRRGSAGDFGWHGGGGKRNEDVYNHGIING
jgi:hypothetical protein